MDLVKVVKIKVNLMTIATTAQKKIVAFLQQWLKVKIVILSLILLLLEI
ncbi:hypothetical protein [Trichormus azollae]